MKNQSQRPRILCVGHGSIESNRGGTEVYQRLIATQLESEFDFFFFSPDLTVPGLTTYRLYRIDQSFERHFQLSISVSQEHVRHPDLERVFAEILQSHQITLVHFHHLIRQVPSLIQVAKELLIPCAFTAHDFYSFCDEYNLIGVRGDYCGVLEKGCSECDSCLYQIRGFRKGSQSRREGFFQEALKSVDVLIFNTEGILNSYQKFFGGLDRKKMKVIEPPSNIEFNVPVNRPTDGKLKILIPNGLSRLKGGDLLLELFQQYDREDVEFHFLGKTDRRYSEKKILQNDKRVFFHGSYSHTQLIEHSRDAHLSIHASIWPETYCISLSEMWSLGILPVASRIGAMGERVTSGVNGFLFTPGSVSELDSLLRYNGDHRQELEMIRRNLHSELVSTPNQFSNQFLGLYRELQSAPVSSGCPLPKVTEPQSWVISKGPRSRFLRKWLIRQ